MNGNVLKVHSFAIESRSMWMFTIENFSQYNEIDQQLGAPVGLNNEDSWYLLCYPHGEKSNNGEYISLYIHYESIEKLMGAELQFETSIIPCYPRVCECKNFTSVIRDENDWQLLLSKKISELTAEKDIYLPNDSLTISCLVTKLSGNIVKKIIPINVPESKFHDNIKSLLQDQKLGDAVILRAKDNKEFKVYRGILTSQSAVFSDILESKDPLCKKIKREDGQESRQQTNDCIPNNVIVVDDMTGQVCERMIEFLHTDKLPLCDDEVIFELLGAAEKYKLIRLKALCEKRIYENLTIEKLSNALITADLCKAYELKEATIQFIAHDIDNFIKTDGYLTLKEINPHLALEMFDKIHRK